MKTLNAETTTNGFVSIKKVLVAVDFSRLSGATAMYAAEIAKSCNASLTIVYVCEPLPLNDYASEAAYTLVASRREEIQTQLDELTQKVQKAGVACDSVFRVGDPAEEITVLARVIGAGLIVTASHHPRLLTRLFNLDKAPQIIHRAPCPVLVYHEKNT
jgi:nucleotide-binding universal stress UspA family protein